LDAEIFQCHSEGIKVDTVQLQLPTAAAAIVLEYNHLNDKLTREQSAFLALQVAGGHIGLVIVVLFSIFSHKVHRDPTFFNFCITWISSSIIFSLQLYRGTSGNTIFNSFGEAQPKMCLAQSALTNGAQVMTACSTAAFVIQLWLGIRTVAHSGYSRGPRRTRWITVTLLAAPYILFLLFTLPSIFIGRKHLTVGGASFELALPTNFYCMLQNSNPFLLAVYGVTLGLLIITVIFDVLIIYTLYECWCASQYLETNDSTAVSLSVLLRVMVFTMYRVVVAVAYGSVLGSPPPMPADMYGRSITLGFDVGVPVWVDMLQAAIPVVGFLVLGLKSDVITVFAFWRKKSMLTTVTQPSFSTETIATDKRWENEVMVIGKSSPHESYSSA